MKVSDLDNLSERRFGIADERQVDYEAGATDLARRIGRFP
jgi:hypothetical protein